MKAAKGTKGLKETKGTQRTQMPKFFVKNKIKFQLFKNVMQCNLAANVIAMEVWVFCAKGTKIHSFFCQGHCCSS